MLTPLHDDATVNEGELRRLVDFYIDQGLNGLFPVGSVGEGVHLSHSEKLRCMEIVVSQAAGRVPVTPGIPGSHPQACLELAHAAADLGCQAVVVTPPYFYRPDTRVVEQFFRTIADASPLPVILYNIPLFTQPLPYELVARLAGHPNIAGMKDSSGSMVDFLHFQDCIRLRGAEIPLLTGREDMVLPALLMGGKGSMNATAAVMPEMMSAIWRHHQAGETDEALRLQRALLAPIRLMFPGLPNGFKLALSLRGFDMGQPLLPLDAAGDAALNALRAPLAQALTEALALVGAPLLVK